MSAENKDWIKPAVTGSVKDKRTHPDLQAERDGASFNTEELKTFMMGGKKMRKSQEYFENLFYNDPILKNSFRWYDMTREEQHELMYKKLLRLHEIDHETFFSKRKAGYFSPLQLMQGILPNGLTQTMFGASIDTLTTEEQHKKWMPDVLHNRLNGCYAQTELGHGSNVAALETTAIFDKEKDEFVIHTPTLSATKFWPGDMGIQSNAAVVYAQLIIDGKPYGVQPFFVQIRDMKTHERLPGILCGDIGPKFGYNSKENGWLQFDNVRIPRTNMLMKFARVDREGKFSVHGDLRTLYSIMMLTRVSMIRTAGHYLACGLTIALRYAAVRRQFATMESKKKERRLLDYQTHQFKLLPCLAHAFAFHFASIKVGQKHMKVIADIKNQDFSGLPLVHHLSASFKSYMTQEVVEQLEVVRQSCGGVGFSANSGLAELCVNFAPQATFEGENTVMAQQGAKLMFKNVKALQRGMKISDEFAYFNNLKSVFKRKALGKTGKDFLKEEVVEDALMTYSLLMVAATARAYAKSAESQTVKENELWANQTCKMNRIHSIYMVFKFFKDLLDENKYQFSAPVMIQLRQLLLLYGLTNLNKDSLLLFEAGYFGPGHLAALLDAQKQTITALRPQAIPLIESWGVPDGLLMSVIGNKYGDIYEQQLEVAKASRLNTGKNPKGFEHFQKVMQAKL